MPIEICGGQNPFGRLLIGMFMRHYGRASRTTDLDETARREYTENNLIGKTAKEGLQ